MTEDYPRAVVRTDRGLAERTGIRGILASFDEQAATKLQSMGGQVAVVVVDHGVAEVFPA